MLVPPDGGGGGGIGGDGSGPPHGIPPFDPNPWAPPTSTMPDWQSLLANNPYYLAAQAMAAQQLAALKAQMGAGASRALINLGDASLAGQVKGLNIPKDTAALVDEANKAGTSVLSQLTHSHDLNAKQIPAVLAGRGFYRSGETGYELGQETRNYGLKQENARQSTLDYLNQLYDNYVNAQFGIQQNTLNAYFQAYSQVMAQIAAGQYGGTGTSGWPQPPPIPGGIPGATPSLSSIKQQLGYGSSQPWTAGL